MNTQKEHLLDGLTMEGLRAIERRTEQELRGLTEKLAYTKEFQEAVAREIYNRVGKYGSASSAGR